MSTILRCFGNVWVLCRLIDYIVTPHAKTEMRRRGIDEEHLRLALAAPEQMLDVRPGRVVYHKLFAMGSPMKTYLVRVFMDVDRQPAEIVTVYRTSKVSKYWRENCEDHL